MILKEIIQMIKNVAIGVIISVFIIHFIGGMATVSQESMQNTLFEGQVLWIEKISTTLDLLKRGDIITIYAPKYITYGSHTLVKRIIAVEGDHVLIKDGKVYVNGSIIKEPYIKGNYTRVENEKFNNIIISKGYLYALGDNRSRPIIDSRTMGQISLKDVTGRALVRVYPFDKIKILVGIPK
jgi:signal peptidase I